MYNVYKDSIVTLLLSSNYNLFVDIRDRAKFYSQILLCVSSEKVYDMMHVNIPFFTLLF